MADTAIEWADKVWNPTVGCMKVSAGCENCYAIRSAYRAAAMGWSAYDGLTRKLPNGSLNWTGEVRTLPERLAIPLGWKKPSRIFVDSMSDLFHEDIPDEFIDQVFAVMAWTPHHTYQVLTKRPERMLRYLTHEQTGILERRDHIVDAMCGLCLNADAYLCGSGGEDCELEGFVWPLPNVWLGTSVEDQRAADERIPLLLRTPAAVRFLSCEPLLGPVDLERWIRRITHRVLNDGVDWVIAGGESGPKARQCDPDWVRSLRDQCQAVDVAFFFKQWGGRTHAAGGRELDGRTWDEYPKAQEVVSV